MARPRQSRDVRLDPDTCASTTSVPDLVYGHQGLPTTGNSDHQRPASACVIAALADTLGRRAAIKEGARIYRAEKGNR